MTQVLQNPEVTENRRDTVDGLDRRISCIHRRYNSRCGLPARFEVADALNLAALGTTFDTIIDSGLFHVFDDGAAPGTSAAWRRCCGPAAPAS